MKMKNKFMTKAEQLDALMQKFTETDKFADWDSFTQAAKEAIGQGAETMTLPTAYRPPSTP